MRVLIVDDSAVVREILSQLLSRDRRISVSTSPDPIVALEKIKRERPDVIITDLEIPRMSGLACADRDAHPVPYPSLSAPVRSGRMPKGVLCIASREILSVPRRFLLLDLFPLCSSVPLCGFLIDVFSASLRLRGESWFFGCGSAALWSKGFGCGSATLCSLLVGINHSIC